MTRKAATKRFWAIYWLFSADVWPWCPHFPAHYQGIQIWNGVSGRGCDKSRNQWRKAPFHWMRARHSVNEGSGKEFHRKGNSLKSLGPFSEQLDFENWNFLHSSSSHLLGSVFGRTDFSRILIFGLPDFFVDFVTGFFLLIFVGKSAQKNPPGESPAKSSKIYATEKSPTHFCRGAGPTTLCSYEFLQSAPKEQRRRPAENPSSKAWFWTVHFFSALYSLHALESGVGLSKITVSSWSVADWRWDGCLGTSCLCPLRLSEEQCQWLLTTTCSVQPSNLPREYSVHKAWWQFCLASYSGGRSQPTTRNLQSNVETQMPRPKTGTPTRIQPK